MEYIKAFVVGGLICMLVQILMEKTKMMPGRIMVLLVAGRLSKMWSQNRQLVSYPRTGAVRFRGGRLVAGAEKQGEIRSCDGIIPILS